MLQNPSRYIENSVLIQIKDENDDSEEKWMLFLKFTASVENLKIPQGKRIAKEKGN